MTKRLLSLSLLTAVSIGAQAQNTVLKADTGIVTGVSSAGNRISAIASNGTLFGSGMNETAFFRVAEDFTIPAGETWRIDSLITYGYQTTSPTTSTFTAGYVRLYNGIPGSGGTLIAGDTTTNRLASSTFSGIYRVNSTATTDVTRPLMRLALTVPATTPAFLAAGNYWVSWSAKGSLASGPWAPPMVLSTTGAYPTGQNGRQNDTGAWTAAVDGTPTIGYNFILKGSKTGGTSISSSAAKSAFTLNAPYPNPVARGGSATVSFSLVKKERVSLRVVNVTGQQVAMLMDEELATGEYIVPFSTTSLASGIYRITLQTENGSTAVPLTVK